MDLTKHVEDFMQNVANYGFSRQNIHDWAKKLTDEAKAEVTKEGVPIEPIIGHIKELNDAIAGLRADFNTLKAAVEGKAASKPDAKGDK